MSRRPDLSTANRFSVASRTTFDSLEVDEGESSDEEVLVTKPDEPVPESVEPKPAPEVVAEPPKIGQSRGAQKRAAKRAAAEAAAAAADASPTATTVVDPASPPAAEEPKSEPQPPAVPAPAPIVNDAPPPLPAVNGGAAPPSPSIDRQSFQPELPSSLPQRSSSSLVRKRKASQDLTTNPLPKETRLVEVHGGKGEGTTVPVEVSVSSVVDQKETERTKKLRNAGIRTIWSLIMIFGFIGLLLLGHAYMILLVMLCQSLVYREVTALFTLSYPKSEVKGSDPWSKTLNWYFFAVANYFLYGETIIYYFKHVVFADVLFLPFATNHRFISFTLYTIGFVGFVASLKKNFLKQQFGLFCWVHMSVLVIVVSSHFIVNNILEGMIWFFVPASLVICNDIFAYIWGVTFGRTPLIKLSPKKTVEGFIGAFFSTLLFGVLWGTLFMRWNYMICPAHDLGTSAFSSVTCNPNPVFVWREWEIPAPARVLISSVIGKSITHITWAPYQLHVLVMSCFASLVAPFGGFFASGFKRAFDIKDFGHSIPGHGGMTDRMDCQFLMGMFSYVYYSSLIRVHHVTVGGVLQTVVSGLSVEEQLQLLGDLKRYLEGAGVKVEL